MAYQKVPINSACPKAADRNHKWITRETKHVVTGKPTRLTWCDLCSAVPK